MPDLRDETAEDGFHEIQFSSKELVFLFMAASVILIFVFLAGVLVGRDTTARAGEPRIADGGSIPAADSTPTPAEEQKPTTGPETPAPTQQDPLSYPTALGGKEAGAPASKPGTEPPAPPPVAESKPEPVTTPDPVVTPEKPPQKPQDAGPSVPTSGKRGEWVIQVVALKTRRAAADEVQRLIGRGYDAFLEDTAKGLYRVRIGKFRTREDADRVARRLEKEGTKSVVQR